MLQKLPLPASHCAFMSSASIPRCGSASGSGSGRSTIAGSICSWSGGAPTTPKLQLPALKSHPKHLGESRQNKLVATTFTPIVRRVLLGIWDLALGI